MNSSSEQSKSPSDSLEKADQGAVLPVSRIIGIALICGISSELGSPGSPFLLLDYDTRRKRKFKH